MDVATADFEQEVLKSSGEIPVLVDFWAPWCSPCRSLGPILEKLEREYAGRIKLVKVNIDEEPQLAQAFGVRSIPDVMAFKGGKAVAHFLGAQPESQVRAFIEKLFPSATEKTLDRAAGLVDQGELDEAERLLGEVPEHIDWEARVQTLRAAIAFARSGGGNPVELERRIAADPADLAARLELAQLHAGRRQYREAMDHLLEIVRRDKGWRDGEARKQLLNIFTLAADDADLVSAYRRKLASTLN